MKSEIDEERARAERALEDRTSATLSELQRREWPAAARRIRDARLRIGLSDVDVAHRIGMTIDSYFDLESSGDEAFTAPSLKQLAALGGILGLHSRMLLLGLEGEWLKEPVTPNEIAARLVKRMTETGLTADQLGDVIGWDINDVLRDPEAIWGFTVDGLYDICKAVGLDWVAALPNSAPATQEET
jgi:transcriptional regulator with XRE-family HTH domain